MEVCVTWQEAAPSGGDCFRRSIEREGAGGSHPRSLHPGGDVRSLRRPPRRGNGCSGSDAEFSPEGGSSGAFVDAFPDALPIARHVGRAAVGSRLDKPAQDRIQLGRARPGGR